MQSSYQNDPNLLDVVPFLIPASTSTELLGSLEDYSDVASWVNDLLDGTDGDLLDTPERPTDLSELDKRVSHLCAMLEVVCEDTSTQLERTIDEISRTVPRLTYDIQFMRESAVSLQLALLTVEAHSGTSVSSEETARALDRLHFLDTAKRNMDASLTVLREAEAWSSLESEVIASLAEQAYTRAASRLSEASKSLAVFQNTPEYESRKMLMVNLQNQLEASLSSALVAGINSRDVDACKNFFEIFCNIERETEFRGYWNGSKRKGVVDLWQGTTVRDCDEEAAAEGSKNSVRKLSSLVSDFYQELLSLLQTERISVTSIFPDPQATLSSFITSTLSSLHPSLPQRLSALASHHGNLVLPEIISVFKATEDFAGATDKVMEKIGYSALFSTSALSTTPEERDVGPQMHKSHSRRRSNRMSMSRKLVHRGSSMSGIGAAGNAFSLDNSWDEAVFEPFIDYQSDYETLEWKFLMEQFQTLMSSDGSSSDGARLLRERSVDVFAMAEESLGRCMAFTHGYGAIGLIKALDNVFDAFLGASQDELITSRAKLSQKANSSVTIAPGGEDFAELDYSAEDYSSFQLALHLLEAARGLLDRLASLEAKLRANLLQLSSALKMMRNDPTGLYFSGTTRGEMGLLHGSALNSAELQNLIDTVEGEPQQSHGQISATPISAGFGGQRQTVSNGEIVLLLGARSAVSDFAKACQGFLQQTILSPLFKHLSTYAYSPVWSSPDNPKARRAGAVSGGGVSEVVIPTFSLSPSQTIQRVAEGLLNLPRLFEVYADDDALAFSIETLPFVDMDDLRTTAADGLQSSENGDGGMSQDALKEGRGHLRRMSMPSMSLKIAASTPSNVLMLTPETVSSAWLASLTLSLLSHLTANVLPSIRKLSDGGAAQLAEDLGYLIQIVRALNVEWEELEQWKEAVELDPEEGQKRRGQDKETDGDGNADVLRKVAKARGWATS